MPFCFVVEIYPEADMTLFAGEILTLRCMVNISSLSNRFEVADVFFTTKDSKTARKIKTVPVESKQGMMSFMMTDQIKEDILRSYPQRQYQSYVCRYSDNSTFCPINYKYIKIDCKIFFFWFFLEILNFIDRFLCVLITNSNFLIYSNC